MQKGDSSRFLRLFVACCTVMLGAQASLAVTPTFTIAATNVTMPTDGKNGTSQITLTSANGYSGKLVVNSQYSGGDMNAKPPNSGATLVLYTLNANSTTSGTLTFFPYGKGIPLARLHHSRGLANPVPVLGLVLAGCFVLGPRLRTGATRWLSLILLGVLSMGLVACGGNGLSGTYPFTVTAADTVTAQTASTQILVTVP